MTPTCPYCRAPFEAEDDVVSCSACGTRHHADCLAENGGCTVFGCSQAPVEEPKISVSAQDVSRPLAAPRYVPLAADRVLAPPPPPSGGRIAVPPPPRPGSAAPPPPAFPAPASPYATRGTYPPYSSPATAMARIRTSHQPTAPALGFAGYSITGQPVEGPSIYVSRKSRVAFVLLAIFFGIFGVHNFYAGYIKKAVIQVSLTVFTLFSGATILWVWSIVWIWAILEACIVNADEDGVAFT